MYRFNRVKTLLELWHKSNLNTTNVSVQLELARLYNLIASLFKYNKCIGSIVVSGSNALFALLFKYNKCIGSMGDYSTVIGGGLDLNTTNVSVQLNLLNFVNFRYFYLNTTNVSVQ